MSQPPLSSVQLGRLLKFRHFRLLEMLDTTRSMRRAAEQLGISTAAVSKSCLEIESILGEKLFKRDGGCLVPTPVLKRIVTTARRMDTELRLLSNDLSKIKGTLYGSVRIGFQAPIMEAILPRLFAEIKREQPFLTLTIEYGMRARLITDLETKRIDFIFIDLLGVESRFRLNTHPLGYDRSIIVTPDGIMEFSDVLANWDQYVDEVWIVPYQGMAMRDKFDSILVARGLRAPERLIEISTPVLLNEMQAACGAVALVPQSLQPAHLPKIAGTPKDSTLLNTIVMEIGVVWSNDAQLSAQSLFVLNKILSYQYEEDNAQAACVKTQP
ncbi:LysR family transcriptional regulator [Komagataeibacter xylinus]|uniref:LysR family transcriptional regulator n=1 Tax=Komagataeibacter xylinus TaxID=28448 RepID=UPI00280AF88F|nr:LysR family transcriptional regulator [Komagataeibacter xylinus]